MTHLSAEESNAQMAAMKAFDEEMPSVGIFWYDQAENDFFGVCKSELTPKELRQTKNLAWAEQPHTINEVGSTYTIQGFDLSFVGVILGPSVKYKMPLRRLNSPFFRSSEI